MASPPTKASMLSILVTFLCICGTFVSGEYANFSKLELPPGVTGAGSVIFPGPLTNVPFMTVTDGRIMKWLGPKRGFVDFAYTSPARTKEYCDGTTDTGKGPICGRPMALSYDPSNGLLYIADAFLGLLAVDTHGRVATQLVDGLMFANGLDVDLLTGNVYVSDASMIYDLGTANSPGFIPDSTGRLLRYDPLTRYVTVLMSGLSGGGGPVVSKDGTFVLVPELGSTRISKYWLVGPKADTAEVLLNTHGNPNKIKRGETPGVFWVATARIGYISPTPVILPEGVRFNSDGEVLETVGFFTQFSSKVTSLVQEHEGKLYVGSYFANFIGVYSN